MQLRRFLIFVSLFIFCAGNAFAQNPVNSTPVLKDGTNGEPEEIYKVGDVRGNIKRKAVYLPKPSFPREALEAGADGAVKVEVVLDTEGNVTSAKAVSGHQLLRNSAEDTARKTKFRKDERTDQTEPETGFITYNFAIEKAGWLRIGYDLMAIQKAPTLRPFIVPRVAKAFQPEWTSENEMLGKLAEMRRVEMETQDSSFTDKPVFVRKSAPQTNGTNQSVMRGEILLPIPNPPTGERIALAQNLIAALQSRLANEPTNLWKFNLGLNLMRAFETSRNPKESRNAAQILRQSAENAPTDIPAESLTALQNLIGIFESGKRTTETQSEIGKSLTVLFRNK